MPTGCRKESGTRLGQWRMYVFHPSWIAPYGSRPLCTHSFDPHIATDRPLPRHMTPGAETVTLIMFQPDSDILCDSHGEADASGLVDCLPLTAGTGLQPIIHEVHAG